MTVRWQACSGDTRWNQDSKTSDAWLSVRRGRLRTDADFMQEAYPARRAARIKHMDEVRYAIDPGS